MKKSLQIRLIFAASFLLTSTIVNLHIPTVSSSLSVNSWADVEVLSFNGETIAINLKIFIVGNHADREMLIRSIPPPEHFGGVQVWTARICDVIFNEETNITIFSYSGTFDSTNYEAKHKLLGYLLFPCDEHSLVLYIAPKSALNFTMDPQTHLCTLPQNYEGEFRISSYSTAAYPSAHKLVVEIGHPSVFTQAVLGMLVATIGGTVFLTGFLLAIVIQIYRKKKSYDLIPNLIRISSAMMFFVPAFEIALYSLKSPLSLVFSDILLIPVILFNIVIMVLAVWLNYCARMT
jgi:hypothetical protein